mmetsp:Transcript_3417/g.2871  ORF Transcript_3417/g.2871 Transcript_3417/m.2871 type:complete len:304 (-) Transcript_3417:198-1109(-)
MKKTLHDMKLQDAIHRQNIRKLEKGNNKSEIEELETTVTQLEKQKAIDEQYLLKQQEIITKSELTQNLEAAVSKPKGKNSKSVGMDTHKEQLKYKKESLVRAQEVLETTKDLEYKTGRIVGDVHQLSEDAEQIEKYPEEDRAPIVKKLFMTMMELMENLDAVAKPENSKVNVSKLSHSRTFTKKSDKFTKGDILDIALAEDNEIIKKQIEDIDTKNSVVKRMRVSAQKGIFNLEKKLKYIEDEVPGEEQADLDNLGDIDLNKEATLTNQRTNEILKNLKSKLETNATGDKIEARLIRELNSAQ